MSSVKRTWQGELEDGTFRFGKGPLIIRAHLDKFPDRSVHIRVPDSLLRVLGERMIKRAEELGIQ